MNKKIKKLVNITPRAMRCGFGPCPAIYESQDYYVIIGKLLRGEELDEIKTAISPDEVAIKIPKGILTEL